MRTLSVLIASIPIIVWALTYRKRTDSFSPKNIITALYAIRVYLPILYLSDYNNLGTIHNENILNAVKSDRIFIIYTTLTVVAYFMLLLGVHFLNKKNNRPSMASAIKKKRYENKFILRMGGIIIWIIGFLAAIIAIYKVGGLWVLLNNQSQRTTMLRDMDLLSWLIPFMSYGCIIIAYTRSQKISFCFLLFAILTGLIQGMGARKPMIMLVIMVFMIYHYAINRLKFKDLLKIQYVMAALIAYTLFSLLLLIRPTAVPRVKIETGNTNDSNAAQVTPKDIAQTNNDNKQTSEVNTGNDAKNQTQTAIYNRIIAPIARESYAQNHMLAIQYFDYNEHWRGKTFLGLLTAPIPSSIFSTKPPVDDGTYLYAISLGRNDINPPMSFKELNVSSLPLETFGSMFANFGPVGVVLGSLIKGMIIGYIYSKIKAAKKNYLLAIYAYIIMIFNFELATLNIFSVITSILSMFLLVSVINLKSYRIFKRYELLQLIYLTSINNKKRYGL